MVSRQNLHQLDGYRAVYFMEYLMTCSKICPSCDLIFIPVACVCFPTYQAKEAGALRQVTSCAPFFGEVELLSQHFRPQWHTMHHWHTTTKNKHNTQHTSHRSSHEFTLNLCLQRSFSCSITHTNTNIRYPCACKHVQNQENVNFFPFSFCDNFVARLSFSMENWITKIAQYSKKYIVYRCL